MAFVGKKLVGSQEYYQLVENRWTNGQPRQRILVHLGRYPTAEAALEQWPGAIKHLGRLAQKWRQKAGRLSKDPSSYSKARAQAILEAVQKAERRASALAAKTKETARPQRPKQSIVPNIFSVKLTRMVPNYLSSSVRL